MELLGEEKIKESLIRVVKAVKILKMNFGRIYIEMGEPILLSQYLKQNSNSQLISKENRRNLVQNLGY